MVCLALAQAWTNAAQGQFLSFQVGSCKTEDEIAANDRKPFEEVAAKFGENILATRVDSIYEQLSDEVKKASSRERVSAVIEALGPMLMGIANLRIAHSLFVTSSGWKTDHTAICTLKTGGPTAKSSDKVFVAAKPIPKQAHVILEGQSESRSVAVVVWLLPSEATWIIQGFHVVPTRMNGKSAADLAAMARHELKEGRTFNAAMLLAGASDLSFRGPGLQLGTWQELQKELKGLTLPEDLRGARPFIWRFGADTFRIVGIGPVGMNGKMALLIRRETTSVDDGKATDDENRRLIAGFATKHQEYALVFDALVVQAIDPRSGKSLGTVEEVRR